MPGSRFKAGRAVVIEGWVVSKAREVLGRYPLCDRCLGRLFARLGYGWSNRERGDAIKRVLVMELHRMARERGVEAGGLDSIAPNIGYQASGLYKLLRGSELRVRECFICGGLLEGFIGRAAGRGAELLRAYDISRFVVGVRVDPSILSREEEVKRELGLPYGESIKSELRREVGKALASLTPASVDFDEPEATVMVHFPSGHVDIQVNSLLIKGVYWKLGRNVSQAYWPSPQGPRYFSVEQALWGLLRLLGGERVVVHAAGREDVDARMLGSGRPVIVEVKYPRRRRVSLEDLERAANEGGRGVVRFKLLGPARRGEVRLYKEEAARVRKVYRALVAVDRRVEPADANALEGFFRGRVVVQRTPLRVAHRRPDIVRRRTVYSVACRVLAARLMECLIEAEGGLYVKELVSGDEGRTTPSFAEVLGSRATCLELDVVWVEREPV